MNSTITSSVIICTRNRKDDLIACLQSLKAQTMQPDELIIVDSSDEQVIDFNEVKNLFSNNCFPKTSLIYKHSDPGLPYQRNVGISLATQDIVYFFDDDVVLQSDYLAQMNTVFTEHPEYGGGMGCVTNIPTQQKTTYRLFRGAFLLQQDYASGNFTASGMPTHVYGTTKFKPVQVLGGCCMAYRKKVFKNHLFDEKLSGYAYMEDCDFSARVSQEYQLFYNPHAKLVHNASPVARDNIIKNRAMFIKNYSYLFFKNFYPHNRLKVVLYWWSVLGLFVEALLYRKWHVLCGYWQGLRLYYFE